MPFIFSELAMLGSPILDSSLNNCGGNGAAGDLADCYSPKLNDSYRGETLGNNVPLVRYITS